LPAANRMRSTAKTPAQDDSGVVWKPSTDVLEALTSSLQNCTVGVAFYDRRLRCQTLNRTFAEICSLRVEDFLGKSLNQSFGRDAKVLRRAFERAFSSGKIVANLELPRASASPRAGVRRLFNLYPLADGSGRIREIAVALCESSNGDSLPVHLAHLVGKLQEGLPAATSLLGAGFPETLARSLQSSARSIRKIRSSMAPRPVLSAASLEMGLLPLALFLSLTGSEAGASPAYDSPLLSPETSREPSSSESAPESLFPAEQAQSLLDVPSPRELQVLRLLAIGQSNKEIGLALGISTRTVETYRARIVRKLSLHSTAELVRYAIRHKIVDP
jgi:DNA-binding CsgD family transcriptional regulator